jgi:transposase-like protein
MRSHSRPMLRARSPTATSQNPQDSQISAVVIQDARWDGGQHSMARPYSLDLREPVVAAVEKGGLSSRNAAVQFGVGVSTAIRWVGRLRKSGSIAPGKMGVTSRGRSRVSTGPGFFDGLRNAAEALALESQFEHLAHNLAKVRDVLYLIRGTNYPIALEGALKAQGNFLHPRRRLCRGRTYRVDRRKDAGQRHRALRPPVQKKVFNICKKSLPAMARSFS